MTILDNGDDDHWHGKPLRPAQGVSAKVTRTQGRLERMGVQLLGLPPVVNRVPGDFQGFFVDLAMFVPKKTQVP